MIRILIVEDDDTDFLRASRLLSRVPGQPYQVDRASTFEEGSHLLQSETYDACLLDIHLGAQSGFNLLREVDLGSRCPAILVLTGHAEDCLDREAQDLGAAGFLDKNELDAASLDRALRYALVARSLARTEGRFQELVENLDQIFWMRDGDGQVLYCSPHFKDLWGVPVERLYANPDTWWDAVDGVDRLAMRGRFEAALRAGEPIDLEYAIHDTLGVRRWVRDCGCPTRERDGSVGRFLGFTQEVTREHEQRVELVRLSDELAEKAMTDPLTGLMNRRGLEGCLDRELSRSHRSGEATAAVLIDADDFKHVNDSLGHATGDIVLQGFARRMRDVLRPTDSLARVGGDEFLAVLSETRLAEAVTVAERLRLAVADSPILLADGPLVVTASFGVAIVPTRLVSIEQVLDVTRQALAESKKLGKNRVVAATDGHGHGCTAAVAGSEIEGLTRGGAIRPFCQEIHHVESGRCVGFEMLSRGPQGPYESPTEFLRLSHEKNVLALVDLECLKVCVRASAALAPSPIHVNVFPSTLVGTPSSRVVEMLERAGGPDRFCIELSEQQFLGTPHYLVQSVRELAEAGVRIAIDDVGYGRSTIEALVVLEPDVIKIAREFVHGADQDPGLRRGLERLTKAASTLSTVLVAEGVETDGERSILGDIGIEYAQGFLWDSPRAVLEPA